MDPYCYNPIPGTDVPLDHMDYGYVSSCSDSTELGKILKILRSEKEGYYPDLIAHTEKRLGEVDPSNKLLIPTKAAQRTNDLSYEESFSINKDMEDWTKNIQSISGSSNNANDGDKSLPPVRKVTFTNPKEQVQPSDAKPKEERIKSFDFDAWSKFDGEKEAAKVDSEEPQVSVTQDKPDIPIQLSEKELALTAVEKGRMADKEREKGNEAFRAGDLEEAFAYYSRSINFNPSVAAYNNRALTEIKLKRYQAAMEDCSLALKVEPSNTKALFRRGTAYCQLGKPHQAATDFERVLHFEPNNKKAQQELNAVRKKLAKSGGQKDNKKTGRRIQIEEVEEKEEKITTTSTSPPPVTETTPTKVKKELPPLPGRAQALKEEGNQLFQAGEYPGALDKYTSAVAILRYEGKCQEGNLSMLLNNRAASQLKLGNCPACIVDCTESLSLVVINVKALMRRGKAFELLEKYKQAYNDYQLALTIDRSLPQAYEASSRIVRVLRDMDGLNWRDKLPVCPEAERIREEQMITSSPPQNSEDVSKAQPTDSEDVGKAQPTDSEDVGKAQPTDSEDVGKAQPTDSEDVGKAQPTDSEDVGKAQLTDSEDVGKAQLTDSEDVGKAQLTDSEDVSKAQPTDSADVGKAQLTDSEDVSKAQPTESEDVSKAQPTDSEDVAKEEFNLLADENDEGSPPSLESADTADASSESVSSYLSTDSSASVEDEMTSDPISMTSDPIISMTSPVSHTTVTQSTQPVTSPRTASPPGSKVKYDDLLSPEEKFEKHKQKGNEHIKKGEYVEALRYYNMCVSVSPGSVVGYTNRALCHLKLNSPRSAEGDCNKALSKEPGNVKALYRRGLARKALGRYAESVRDLHLLLTIDPDNPPAKKELAETKQLWEKQLREIQARTITKDKRPERRNAKAKKAGGPRTTTQRPPGPGGAQKPPTKEELEKFQKLLKELEASKEKIEQLSKSGGPMWGGMEGLGGLPFTGPPPPGKSPNGSRKTAKPAAAKAGGKSPSASKPKTKKVPKKPSKATVKSEPQFAERSEVKGHPPPEEVKSSPVTKMKRIVIEEIHSSDDELTTPPMPVVDTPPLKEDSAETELPPPSLNSPFEFVQRWNAIPRTAKSSEYARLLEAIPPSSLPGVITNKLDAVMLTNVIRAMDKQFVPKGKYKLCAEILTSLSEVPRFGMVSMFMGQQEKSDLSHVLAALSSAEEVSTASIEHIKQVYSL